MPPDQPVNPAAEPSPASSPSQPQSPAAEGTSFSPGVLRAPVSRIRVQAQVMRIGRGPGNDLVVTDLGVSKQHAEAVRRATPEEAKTALQRERDLAAELRGRLEAREHRIDSLQAELRALAAGNPSVLPVLDRLGIRPEPEA